MLFTGAWRADLAGATNANVYTLTRCGREFLLRFLFPFREGVARRLLLGMWKDDGRRRRSRTQVGGIVMWPFKKGHQVRDVPSALKVEFNCWRKFRIQGRVHTISTVCPSQGHRHWDHGSYTVLVAFRRFKINHSFAHEEGVKYSLCAYKQRNVRVYYFHLCLCEYYLRNWIKRDICNVIKMIIDKGFSSERGKSTWREEKRTVYHFNRRYEVD